MVTTYRRVQATERDRRRCGRTFGNHCREQCVSIEGLSCLNGAMADPGAPLPARARAEGDRLRKERDESSAEPSFHALFESMKRQREWLQRDHSRRHPIWKANAKMAGRSLAASLGLSVPRLMAGPMPGERLEQPNADRFVVKPVEGHSGRGVYVLVWDRGRLWSVLDDRPISWDEIRDRLAAEAEADRISREAFVEELIPGDPPPRSSSADDLPPTLPFDWKCYCIGGRVEVVMQKDARGRRGNRGAQYKFWTRDLTELGPVRHQNRYDASLPAPRHPRDLVENAERVARALPGPFVRVDLYDGPVGVVFGEITPHPGGEQRFTPDLDRRLGEAWERALAAEMAALPDTPSSS
jgi:TupA-like ATPgrasp